MVGTILPIVYGDRQQGKRPVSLWLHTLGYVIGGAAVGGMFGVIGAALPVHRLHIERGLVALLVTGSICLLYSLRELHLVDIPTPQFYRQVPETWRFHFQPKVAALLYGLGLGVGLATRIPVSTFYAVVLWAVLVGSPPLGMLGMAIFGFGRALPLLCAVPFLDDSEAAVRFQSLNRLKPAVQVLNGIALGFAGPCLLAVALMRH
ncbi:MAG TPA: sulfite exporter TauE/SafE family protein [Blastocatellia bacterium]|nr:sulfite exporter TauE/SafE family protein [Blastocatellia bacterium]